MREGGGGKTNKSDRKVVVCRKLVEFLFLNRILREEEGSQLLAISKPEEL